MSCIYKIFYTVGNIKQITSPGWMHETSARTWCTGKTQRDWVEREVGEGIRMGKTCKSILIHVNVWQKPLQYCKVISLQIKKKKKKTLPYLFLNINYIKLQLPHCSQTLIQFSTRWTSFPSSILFHVIQRSWALYREKKFSQQEFSVSKLSSRIYSMSTTKSSLTRHISSCQIS